MSNTESVYPSNIDDHLRIPLTPTVARLSEAEAPQDFGSPLATNTNSHSDLHNAENNSIKQLQMHALVDDSVSSHDHSDPWNTDYSQNPYLLHPNLKKGRRLRVQNTHVFTDNSNASNAQASRPDSDLAGIHHSLSGSDSGGDFQGVSMQLWKKKNLPDVPDSFFDQTNNIKNEWDTGFLPYPGDNLGDILVAIVAKMKDIYEELDGRLDDHEDRITELEKRVDSIGDRVTALESGNKKLEKAVTGILDKVWGNPHMNADGSINWGKGNNSWQKIPMGDLNIFSNSNPNNDTVADAIRSRDLMADDMRVQ